MSHNAQWHSQSANVLWRIKPCTELCNLFVGPNTRSYLNREVDPGNEAG
jgi:hypothetical protein